MTDTTFSNQKKFPFGTLFIALLLIVIGMVTAISLTSNNNSSYDTKTVYAVSFAEITYDEARIIEIVSGHAWQQHGEEVNQAFDCLKKNGTAKSFKTSGFTDPFGKNIPTNLWLCYNGKDFFAIVTTPFEKMANNQIARLVTAYKVAKDVFPAIGDFINYIADKWNASEINYIIKAGEDIFLAPK